MLSARFDTSKLEDIQRRLRTCASVICAVKWGAIGLLLTALYVVATRLVALPSNPYLFGGIGLVGFVVGAFLGWRKCPSLLDVAIITDIKADTKEVVSTAYQLHLDSAPSLFREALLVSAEDTLSTVTPRQVARLPRGKRYLYPIVLALAIVGLNFIPAKMPGDIQAGENLLAGAKEIGLLQTMEKKLEAAKTPQNEKDILKIQAKIQTFTGEIKAGKVTARKAVAKINEIKRDIETVKRKEQARAEAFEKFKDPPAKDWTEAIKSGDDDKVKAALEKLQKELAASPEAREKFKEQLKAAIEGAKDDPALKKTLLDAQKAFDKGDYQEMAKKLAEAAKQLQGAGDKQKSIDALGEAAKDADSLRKEFANKAGMKEGANINPNAGDKNQGNPDNKNQQNKGDKNSDGKSEGKNSQDNKDGNNSDGNKDGKDGNNADGKNGDKSDKSGKDQKADGKDGKGDGKDGSNSKDNKDGKSAGKDGNNSDGKDGSDPKNNDGKSADGKQNSGKNGDKGDGNNSGSTAGNDPQNGGQPGDQNNGGSQDGKNGGDSKSGGDKGDQNGSQGGDQGGAQGGSQGGDQGGSQGGDQGGSQGGSQGSQGSNRKTDGAQTGADQGGNLSEPEGGTRVTVPGGEGSGQGNGDGTGVGGTGNGGQGGTGFGSGPGYGWGGPGGSGPAVIGPPRPGARGGDGSGISDWSTQLQGEKIKSPKASYNGPKQTMTPKKVEPRKAFQIYDPAEPMKVKTYDTRVKVEMGKNGKTYGEREVIDRDPKSEKSKYNYQEMDVTQRRESAETLGKQLLPSDMKSSIKQFFTEDKK